MLVASVCFNLVPSKHSLFVVNQIKRVEVDTMYNKINVSPLAGSMNDGSSHENENLVQERRVQRPLRYYWQKLMSWGRSGAKPESNPNGWPLSTEEDIAERPTRQIIVGGGEQDYLFCNNFVKTSKYEVWDFPGKFLMEEFDPTTKVANCYFLMISALQCVGPISNTGGIPTTLIPLLFIIFVDATFQLLEDSSRHKADKKENASLAHRYDPMSRDFVECKWFEIAVGDYIRIDTRAMVPADVLIMAVAEKTSPPQGMCYVETKSLDGETNLKIKAALPGTMAKIKGPEDLHNFIGKVEMEHPNKLIESFSGVITLGNQREPMQAGNMLLRGCVLRNTDWIIGLVVNTGHDTKIMMSSATTKSKRSSLETACSSEIQKIILMLAVLCFTGATGQVIWNKQNDVGNIWYLNWQPSEVGFWFVDFFYFFLLHATFIPVSLYVSMSVIRYFQAYIMNNDLAMYYAHTDTPALVRTLTLNEELGQVSHIFSDKTGTLTCNIMDFRKASIHGVSYGLGITEIGKAAWKLLGKPISPEILEGEARAKAHSVPHVSFYSPQYDRDHAANGAQKQKNIEFFRILAICHDVIPEKVDGKIKLSASNPDDEALVCASDYFGFQFCDRVDKLCVVHNRELGIDEEIEMLAVIPFTSKRKRMSVIIRDTDRKIKLLCKGADTAMLPRLRSGQDALVNKTNKDMRDFAVEGLRCLIIASSVLTTQEFEQWNAAYAAASSDLSQIELKKKGEPNRIEELEDKIENGLTLNGATAIEDRLQDGVPECIAELAKAGINIWVLTGDKEETAINIAVACNLVLPKQFMDHIVVNNTVAPDDASMRKLFIEEIKRYDTELEAEGENADALKPRALIIDGPSLIIAMADSSQDGLKDLLLDLSQRCKAVVGCRVSPDQKREMVNLIKNGLDGVRTLAIGDGANDVAMIQAAHIGVGIKGEEGLQAVNSSDYAIAQFRFLSDLMLKHGRYNYIRMSNAVCYIFYKNILMSIAQFWFNFSCAFSGQKYYTEGAIQMFNFLFTNLPLIMMGVYDTDIAPSSAHKYPQIYLSGINDEYFKPLVFWGWIFTAVVESTFISALPLFTLANSDPVDGTQATFLEAGMTAFTVIVLVVNLKLFFVQSKWYYASYLVMGASIGLYFAVCSFITSVVFLDFHFYQVWNHLLDMGAFWLTVILLTVLILAKDIYISGLERNFNFKPWHIIQEMELNGSIYDEMDHPRQSFTADPKGVQLELHPTAAGAAAAPSSSSSSPFAPSSRKLGGSQSPKQTDVDV